MRSERCTFVFAAVLAFSLMANAATPTQTSLTVSSSSVAVGTTVVLAATVTSNGAPVHPGTVVFCKATAAFCEDFAVLGSAQLGSNGVAHVAVRLPPNMYSIKAVFQGTPNSATPFASSTSNVNTLTVSGLSASVAGPVVATPDNGLFDLSTTVAGFGASPLTGTVTFQDTVRNGTPLTLGVESLTTVPVQPQFAAPGSVPLPVPSRRVRVGDFNNDGLPDFLVLSEVSDGNTARLIYSTVVLLNNGDGTYQTITQYFPTTIYAQELTVGDFNGDGLLDIVVFDYNSRTLIPMLGDGHGHFTALSAVAVQGIPSSSGLLVADINGDGNLDVLSEADPQPAEVLLGTGDGNLLRVPVVGPVFGSTTVLKDINGDGFPDVVATGKTGTIQAYLGNGNGTFTYKWASTPPITGYSMVSADFNNDGVPDLLTADDGTNVGRILTGNGDGTFTASYSFNAAYDSLGQLGTGDFNGDGKPDAYFYSLSNGIISAVQVALGKGDGTLEAPYTSLAQNSYFPTPLPVDTNSDGLTDFIFLGLPANSNLYLSELTKQAALSSVMLGDNLDHVITAIYSGSADFAPSSATYDVITFPNVTGQLRFTSSGFLYSRPRQAYVGTITVTNISAATIAGPLQIGFTGLPYKVTVLNPTVNKNQGFFTAPAGLAPGQTASFAVQFSNPNNVAITYNLIAYTGAF